MIPFIDLRAGWEELRAEIDDAWNRVVEGGRYVLGQEVEAFEHEFAALCGTRYCVAVGSGLDALALILRAWGIGREDEVLVPAYTAIATWMAVNLVGATPVGVDIDPVRYTMDPKRIERALSARTRAILPVHLFGQPADMSAITTVAAKHGLRVAEDAAQAHGAVYNGRPVGSWAPAAAFSFYPTKNLGGMGDGGAIVTDDGEVAEHVRLLRSYGWRERDRSVIKGQNSRLDELQAAFLRVKLARLGEWNARRDRLAHAYHQTLADVPGLSLPAVANDSTHAWHLFVATHRRRDELRARLQQAGIGTLVHYTTPPHLTKAYRSDGWTKGAFPVTEQLASTAVSLPLYPQLTEDSQASVIACVTECCKMLAAHSSS